MLASMLIGLGAAVLGAALFGVLSVIQAVAARRLPDARGLLLVVAALYVVGWGLHLVAIGQLPLYLAQAAISASLVFTMLVAAQVLGEWPQPRHWAALLAVAAGLTLLAIGSGDVGEEDLGGGFLSLLVLGLLVLFVLAWLAFRAQGPRSGVLLGTLAGAAYAGTPLATRALVDPAWDLVTLGQLLVLGAYGLLAFALYTLAMRRTSVTSATAPLIVLQTLLPAAIGLVFLGDGIRDGWIAAIAAGIVLSLGGAIALADVAVPAEGSTVTP